MLNKEWVDFFQKLTNAQIEIIRKYSLFDDKKANDQDQTLAQKNSKSDGGMVQKSVSTTLPLQSSIVVPQKEQKVILFLF